jgi:hypothetical protein
MYIWDIKEEMIEARIPLPVYDDLYKALLLIQAAFELEPKLPSAARKITHSPFVWAAEIELLENWVAPDGLRCTSTRSEISALWMVCRRRDEEECHEVAISAAFKIGTSCLTID